MSVLRSPLFADHGGKRLPESPYIDQGIIQFNYAVAVQKGSDFSKLSRAAQEFNTQNTYVLESAHKGKLPAVFSGFDIDAENIILAALKRSEDGSGFIARLYEVNGENSVSILQCSVLLLSAKRTSCSLHGVLPIWK
jgi:alpha-mannosidase